MSESGPDAGWLGSGLGGGGSSPCGCPLTLSSSTGCGHGHVDQSTKKLCSTAEGRALNGSRWQAAAVSSAQLIPPR